MRKPGEKLSNGAVVLDQREDVVLAIWVGRAMPFVTWRIDENGGCFWGEYHTTLEAAWTEYQERVAARKLYFHPV